MVGILLVTSVPAFVVLLLLPIRLALIVSLWLLVGINVPVVQDLVKVTAMALVDFDTLPIQVRTYKKTLSLYFRMLRLIRFLKKMARVLTCGCLRRKQDPDVCDSELSEGDHNDISQYMHPAADFT